MTILPSTYYISIFPHPLTKLVYAQKAAQSICTNEGLKKILSKYLPTLFS